jgi:hypothetical protein
VQRNEHILTKFVQNKIFLQKCGIIIDTGNCVPGKRENNDGSHTRGRNFRIYSCLFLYYVVKELYAKFVRTNVILGNSPYRTEQFALQRNEHILTKIVQNKLFLQKCGIDTVIMTNSCYFFRKIRLTPEIVYQASGRTMTDRTHEVGIS